MDSDHRSEQSVGDFYERGLSSIVLSYRDLGRGRVVVVVNVCYSN